jgi:phage-related protein
MIIDMKISPKNLLEWSDMEDWVNGTSSAPTQHTLTGTGATIAREGTIIKAGLYSAAVTRVGNDAMLYHDYFDFLLNQGRKLTFGCWVYATVASRARISIGDGVGTTNSSYHSGVAGWEFLTVTRNIDSAATRIRCGMEVNTGNTTAYFDGGILVEGAIIFTNLTPYIESYKPAQKIRMTNFIAARRVGTIIPKSTVGERTLQLSGRVFGSTYEAARIAFDSLIQAFTQGEKDLYLYDDRVLRVYLQNFEHEYIAASRVIRFNLRLVSQRPFNYFIQKKRVRSAISAPPTTFTVNNLGNIDVYPVITLTAGGTDIENIVVENLTTRQAFSFANDVLTTKKLVVDSESLFVENDFVDEISAYAGDFIYLAPGANEIKFTGDNCTIDVDFKDAWL